MSLLVIFPNVRLFNIHYLFKVVPLVFLCSFFSKSIICSNLANSGVVTSLVSDSAESISSVLTETLLKKDWNMLDRILRDSEHWANAKWVPQYEKESNDEYSNVILESAARLTEYLQSFADSVQESAERIENHAKDFVFDSSSNAPELRDLNVSSLIDYNSKLHNRITTDYTSFHLPVEIYEGSDRIREDLAWSRRLRDIFNFTHESNNNTYWSYFGTPLGLLRVYPGTPLDLPTLYDVRLDHWYIQSSTPPKHMLIAIDASGSVYGLVLELMKNTASQLLDTLNDNDFVSIIGFHDMPFQLKTCMSDNLNESYSKPSDNFLRATDRNKLALKQLMQKSLVAENIANFQSMFSYSYSLFENLTEEEALVPPCSKILMVITDGGDGEAKDAFSKVSQQASESVRIFTYVEGSSVYADDSLSWIACRNKGFFHKVPTNEAVRMQAMEYLQVLSRPMALNYHQKLFFSAPEIQYWNRNLGHALAATFPVYRHLYSDHHEKRLPHFLGVVGLDIPLFEIGQRIPIAGFSHDSVVLMINAKSHIVYHSSFFLLSELKIPYTPSVDVSELLHLNNFDFEELKRKMLSLKIGTVAREKGINATIHIERYAYNFICDLLYSRISVSGSVFVIMILIPSSARGTVANNIINWEGDALCGKMCQDILQNPEPSKSSVTFRKQLECVATNSCGKVFVAPLPYCPKLQKFTSNNTSEMIEGLKLLFRNDKSSTECLVHDDQKYHYGKSLLQEVKLALEDMIPAFWRFKLTPYDLDEFLITSSGISIIFNNSVDPLWWQMSRNPLNSPLFKKHLAFSRLLPSGSDAFMFTVSYQYDPKDTFSGIEPLPDCFGVSGVASISANPYPVVTKLVTRSIDPNKVSESKVPLGVLGKIIDTSFFGEVFNNTSNGALCSTDQSGFLCYLVDDGGFIIASTANTSLTGENT